MPESWDAAGYRGVLIGACLLALCSTVAASQPSRGAASLTGTVVDQTGAALPGVEVVMIGARRRAVTGERGEFRFASVGTGAQRLIARRPGYLPETVEVELTADDTVALWLELKHLTTMLAKVEVTETYESPRLRGFEDRRLRNIGGRFISAADIKAQAPTETSDLLRRVMGVRMTDSSHVLIPVSSRGNKIVRIGTQLVSVPCTMRIGVNGFITHSSFSMNLIAPNDIHGIEVYPGAASIPAEFNRTAVDLYCGLIMIWTKSGS